MLDTNQILVLSVGVLAFFSFCLFVVIVPVAYQFLKTLSTLQSLLDVVNDDLKPMAKELKTSVSGIKNLVGEGKTLLNFGLRDTKVVVLSSAYGFLAAIKDYFLSYKMPRTSYNGRGKNEQEIKSKIREGDEYG